MALGAAKEESGRHRPYPGTPRIWDRNWKLLSCWKLGRWLGIVTETELLL